MDKDARLYCCFTGDWVHYGFRADGGGLLDLSPLDAGAGGQDISARTTTFGGRLLAGPWRQ